MTTSNPAGPSPLRRTRAHSISHSWLILRPPSRCSRVKRGEVWIYKHQTERGPSPLPHRLLDCLAAGAQKLCLITPKNSLKNNNALLDSTRQIMRRLLFRQPYVLFVVLHLLLYGDSTILSSLLTVRTNNTHELSHTLQSYFFSRSLSDKSPVDSGPCTKKQQLYINDIINTRTRRKAHMNTPVNSLYDSG